MASRAHRLAAKFPTVRIMDSRSVKPANSTPVVAMMGGGWLVMVGGGWWVVNGEW
jgi:hypothetical protein